MEVVRLKYELLAEQRANRDAMAGMEARLTAAFTAALQRERQRGGERGGGDGESVDCEATGGDTARGLGSSAKGRALALRLDAGNSSHNDSLVRLPDTRDSDCDSDSGSASDSGSGSGSGSDPAPEQRSPHPIRSPLNHEVL